MLAFERTGFVAAGIEEVGRAPGVSGPSMYRHFKSKSELLDTLVARRESWQLV
ncbi:helix-turn-helix domain-containing protein [Nocardia sp. CY41]|uniref:helix-turn-helix domain-containing protein n=1 Tax=Nocardia sp. CY41 TaxID=2608686 RepID=UPI003FA5CE95